MFRWLGWVHQHTTEANGDLQAERRLRHLRSGDGRSSFSLAELDERTVVLAFFKKSCPFQYAFLLSKVV